MGETQSLRHSLRNLLQELGPSGVLEGEPAGAYFERIPDRSVHDGLRPLSKGSLSGSGFDKLSVALAQGKADRADILDV